MGEKIRTCITCRSFDRSPSDVLWSWCMQFSFYALGLCKDGPTFTGLGLDWVRRGPNPHITQVL